MKWNSVSWNSDWKSDFSDWVRYFEENGNPREKAFNITSDIICVFTYKPDRNLLVASLSIAASREKPEEELSEAKNEISSEISGAWNWGEIERLDGGYVITGEVKKEWTVG